MGELLSGLTDAVSCLGLLGWQKPALQGQDEARSAFQGTQLDTRWSSWMDPTDPFSASYAH